jgi:periplasmic divalent cation tolerance protein
MTHDDTGCVVVLTTIPVDFDVEGFARGLLDEGLAACVNVLPEMRSIYRWKGAIESAGERQVVIKTVGARLDALRAAIEARHPYEVPEFLVLPVSGGSEAYLAWVRAESGGRPGVGG